VPDSKPTNAEEEYFARENAERLRKIAAEQKAALAAAEREALRQAHYMRCPKCGLEMQEIQFRGVAIDRCFSCGGTYLDGGEFEKLARAEDKGVMSAVLNIFK
jgi:uncharacterized protein with PIN domain